MSMKPGQTILPVAWSTVPSAGAASPAPTRSMRPPLSSTSCTASIELAGSTTRPFRMSRLPPALPRGGPRHGPPHPPTLGAPRGTRGAPRSPARSRRLSRLAAGQQVEDAHAYRHALGHLVEDHRVGPVGYLGGELDAAVHR